MPVHRVTENMPEEYITLSIKLSLSVRPKPLNSTTMSADPRPSHPLPLFIYRDGKQAMTDAELFADLPPHGWLRHPSNNL
jgi:hypothetical protein